MTIAWWVWVLLGLFLIGVMIAVVLWRETSRMPVLCDRCKDYKKASSLDPDFCVDCEREMAQCPLCEDLVEYEQIDDEAECCIRCVLDGYSDTEWDA